MVYVGKTMWCCYRNPVVITLSVCLSVCLYTSKAAYGGVMLSKDGKGDEY